MTDVEVSGISVDQTGPTPEIELHDPTPTRWYFDVAPGETVKVTGASGGLHSACGRVVVGGKGGGVEIDLSGDDTLRERDDYTAAEWDAVPAGTHFLLAGRECIKLGTIDPGQSVYADDNKPPALRERAERLVPGVCLPWSGKTCPDSEGRPCPHCTEVGRIEAALAAVVEEAAGVVKQQAEHPCCSGCCISDGNYKKPDLDWHGKQLVRAIRQHFGVGE